MTTCNSQPITRDTINGVDYYTTTRQGVEYTAFPNGGDSWFVASRRLALGSCHIGGGKIYRSLDDMASKCKAFAALPTLIGCFA